MSQISVRAGSMCPISLLCRIHYTIKITLVQCVSPAVWFARADAEPRGKKRKRKKPPAGHHFHWQLVNKLKKRDAGTIFLPLFFCSLALSLLLHSCRRLVLSQKIFLEVMDFSGAGAGGGYISLKSGAQQRFFSTVLLHPYISAPIPHCCFSSTY